MRRNRIAHEIAAGRQVINGWLSTGSAHVAEIMANQGYDSLTIDMQHGVIDDAAAFAMLQAISTTETTPMVRVPWNDPAVLMRVLDAGAFGIVCPMVNSRKEAEAFVAACRYPPRGFRSFGPNRAVLYARASSSRDYAQEAESEILLFAMIETRAGLENLDEIVETPGLDGLYVGPGDLSFALGVAPSMAPADEGVLSAIERIRSSTRAAGLIAAVHTDGPETAAKRFAEGFQLCTLQGDTRLLADGAAAQVRAAREYLQSRVDE